MTTSGAVLKSHRNIAPEVPPIPSFEDHISKDDNRQVSRPFTAQLSKEKSPSEAKGGGTKSHRLGQQKDLIPSINSSLSNLRP